jgi:hypothetical protein
LEPIPAPGWSFTAWEGADAGKLRENEDGTWSLLMDDDRAVAATFTRDEYTLNVSVSPSSAVGRVEQTPGNPYYYGALVTLKPIPVSGWEFVEWLGADSTELVDNGDGTWSVTMARNLEITALFGRAQYDVLVTVVGQGDVENSPGNPYSYNEVATLNPIPAPGWSFDRWDGPDAYRLADNFDGTWSLRMQSDGLLTAVFFTRRILLPLVARLD